MRYDGTGWYDATPANVDSISGVLYTIYGRGPNDIWAAGYEYAMHFDGTGWSKWKVADSMLVPNMSGNSQYIYATAYSPWGRDLRMLLVFGGNRFHTIDTTGLHSDAKFGLLLWALSNKLTTFSNGVVSATINSDGTIGSAGWTRELTTATYFRAPAIQSETNVLAFGQHNLSYHFNGTDWARIEITVPGHTVSPIAFFYGQWANANEVFVCDVNNGIVYHGR
jgi:hypothetical protein